MVSFARSSKFISLYALFALGTFGALSCNSPATIQGAGSSSSHQVRVRQNRRLRNVTPSSPGCKNPIALDDVPDDWTQIKPESLITGDNGVYLLESVVFHEEIQFNDGTDSMTATSLVTNRSQGKDVVSQSMDCNQIRHDLPLMEAAPIDSFSQQDGSYSKRLEIDYQFKGGTPQSQSPKIVDETGDFVQSHTKTLAKFQSNGFDSEIRYYAISDQEFEMRRMVAYKSVKQFMAMRFMLTQQ